MFSKVLVLALAASPLVAAHGKIAVMTGDAGGNGTALGIQGGIIPGPGKNGATEKDTTVFGNTNIATNGLGKTTGQGKNTVAMASKAMALSGGGMMPQVSASGGYVSGDFHIVTSDGAGPVEAMIDPTGTGAFATGMKAQVMTQVPGKGGNIKKASQRGLIMRTLVDMGIVKRATNINEDFPVKIAVPAGVKCTGTMGGQQNVCLMKIANNNKAGPFGGCVPFQIAGTGAAPAAAGAAAAAPAAAGAAAAAPAAKAATKAAKAAKATREFSA